MKKAFALITCFALILCLFGCSSRGTTTPPNTSSPGEENKTDKEETPALTPAEQVEAYRAIPEVKSFFNDASPLLGEIMDAAFAGDKTTAILKLSGYTDICKSFIDVKNVPEVAKPAHEKYKAAAFLLWDAAIDIASEKYADATGKINEATELISEGHKLLSLK